MNRGETELQEMSRNEDQEEHLHHLRSPAYSEQGDISDHEDILVIDNLVSEDAPLMINPNQRPSFGNFRVEILVLVVYQYFRMVLAILLFAYCLMMFFNKERRPGVYYSRRKTIQADLPLYSAKDIRVVICVILMIFFSPTKISVLFNLMSRKSVTQLKFTMIFCIIFILNCSDDEFNFAGVSFVEREKEDRFSRVFGDLFYGISIERSNKVILNLCYALFDLILYPNILFFLFTVLMFILVVLLIVFFTFTNYLGLTSMDLEDRNRQGPRRNVGLSRQELARLATTTFGALELTDKAKESKDQNTSQGSNDSGLGCSICYIPFTADNKVVALPKCEHLYHTECILSWFKTRTTCPICRLDMRDYLRPDNEPSDIFDKLNHSMFRMTFD